LFWKKNRAQALKHLSPNTTEQDIFAAAKNFELALYQRSTDKVSEKNKTIKKVY
jgi:hypothetical protein